MFRISFSQRGFGSRAFSITLLVLRVLTLGWATLTTTAAPALALDTTPPVLDSLSIYDSSWTIDDGSAYKITLRATDSESGVGELRALINYLGSNSKHRRGHFSWRHPSLGYRWTADQVACDGGGFASKHPTGFYPDTVTLVDCTTTLDGDQRTVELTVRPNPSFGVFGPINDIAFKAWDVDRNSTDWQNYDLDFSSQLANGLGDVIGYQGIVDEASLRQSIDEGIASNVATLIYQRKTCSSFYWRTVDTQGILDAYGKRNVQAMVILENFLMKDVNDPEGDDCQPLAPPPPHQDSDCFQDQKWRLLPDWQARLDEFASLHGSFLNPQNTAFFLLSSEVNDRCMDMAEVEEVAFAVHRKFPGIPLAFIYGASHDVNGVRRSQPPPTEFPKIFDIVGLFSYDNYDVADPLEPRNATGSYYNPQNPRDSTTIYGDLLAKLQPHQKVLLVFDADFGCSNKLQGWIPEDLSMVALNYVDFMSSRPEVAMMGGFTWDGLLSLPRLVKDIHATMACEYFVNDSPVCAGDPGDFRHDAVTGHSQDVLDFDEHTIESYGGARQAGNATVTVEDDGATLHVVGNGWHKIFFPYDVTADTVLEFDFRSGARGDVHGIGFDVDESVSGDRYFKVYGTQDWGIRTHDDYASTCWAPSWRHYVIRVGDYFTGEQLYLTFVNDHDVAGANGESYYSNIRVHE